MFIVAVAELRPPLEQEATELARDLQTTPYEARLQLSGALPSIVHATPDRDRAFGLFSRMRERGQGVIACSTDDIVASERMVSMRRFALEEDALVTDDGRLPFDDVLCLLRAMQRSSTTATEEVKDRKIAIGKAVLTGGLMTTKTVKKEVTTTVEQREQVLYVFRRSAQTPWLLEESKTNYQAVGAARAPTTALNFAATIKRLRAVAPSAAYDERLLRPPRAVTFATHASDVDVAAHLLALWFAQIDRQLPPLRR